MVDIPNLDVWVCATGARHSKSLKRRFPRTARLRRDFLRLKLPYTRCALIRDRHPTALHGPWDGFVHLAETEATCIWKLSLQIVVERFLKVYYECQVRGSFCERRSMIVSLALSSETRV